MALASLLSTTFFAFALPHLQAPGKAATTRFYVHLSVGIQAHEYKESNQTGMQKSKEEKNQRQTLRVKTKARLVQETSNRSAMHWESWFLFHIPGLSSAAAP